MEHAPWDSTLHALRHRKRDRLGLIERHGYCVLFTKKRRPKEHRRMPKKSKINLRSKTRFFFRLAIYAMSGMLSSTNEVLSRGQTAIGTMGLAGGRGTSSGA